MCQVESPQGTHVLPLSRRPVPAVPSRDWQPPVDPKLGHRFMLSIFGGGGEERQKHQLWKEEMGSLGMNGQALEPYLQFLPERSPTGERWMSVFRSETR